MSKRNIHIVPNRDAGIWEVKQEGSGLPISTHRTQYAANETGRQMAKLYQVELVIHGRDGRIRDKDSFGNDPHPPKDRRH